jgi:NDP-sugar pyrophosphorylase family protein
MRPFTEKIPKGLLRVAGKPFIVHQLCLLAARGVTQVVLCVGYLGEQIQATVGGGQHLGLNVAYSCDWPELLGTGGALRKALPLLGERFMVLYGDSYLEIEYPAVAEVFLNSGQSALMTIYRNQGRYERSNVLFRNNRILAYDKNKPLPEMEYIDYGLGCFNAEIFRDWPGEKFDLADAYTTLAANGRLAGYEAKMRFYEIGSPAGLAELDAHLSRKSMMK